VVLKDDVVVVIFVRDHSEEDEELKMDGKRLTVPVELVLSITAFVKTTYPGGKPIEGAIVLRVRLEFKMKSVVFRGFFTKSKLAQEIICLVELVRGCDMGLILLDIVVLADMVVERNLDCAIVEDEGRRSVVLKALEEEAHPLVDGIVEDSLASSFIKVVLALFKGSDEIDCK
jgi:hypothetical protein